MASTITSSIPCPLSWQIYMCVLYIFNEISQWLFWSQLFITRCLLKVGIPLYWKFSTVYWDIINTYNLIVNYYNMLGNASMFADIPTLCQSGDCLYNHVAYSWCSFMLIQTIVFVEEIIMVIIYSRKKFMIFSRTLPLEIR